MFTGIVEEMGVVQGLIQERNLCTLKVRAKKISAGLRKGDSVAVDGACLTVKEKQRGALVFDVMLETLRKTTLGGLKRGAHVNLERALRMSDRFSGHFVTGHVDAIARIRRKITKANYVELQIGLSGELRKYIVPKGSVCLDGVSLTAGAAEKNHFSVYLIPFTLGNSTLGKKKEGDGVNFEADILAKYVMSRGFSQTHLGSFTP